MPVAGVTVTTNTSPGPSSTTLAPTSTYFVAGLTERGPTTAPIKVRSMAEYLTKCGNQVTYGSLYYDLINFFAKGGIQAYIARVVGTAASAGVLTVNDRAGSPLPTLTFTATSPGAWSSQVSVQILAGQVANTFEIDTFLNGVLQRRYTNLANPAAAATAMASDPLVTATVVADVTVAPNNNPAVQGPTALSAGNDQRGSVVASTYTAALALFTAELGTGVVAIPGQPIDNVGAGIEAHCLAFGRIGYTAAAQGVSQSSVIASVATLVGSTGSEYIGCFWPWIQVGDGFGNVIVVSPEGAMAGARAQALTAVGPAKMPAGDAAFFPNVLGLDPAAGTVDATVQGNLENNNVSCIRVISGHVEAYGYRSLSTDTTNFYLLGERDFMNFVAWNVVQILKSYVWGVVDGKGQFFSKMSADITGFLEGLRSAPTPSLFELVDSGGTLVDPGYSVDTGPDVNTLALLAQNIVTAAVAVRKAATAELINVTITKVALTAAI
jgi:hypothetical protein